MATKKTKSSTSSPLMATKAPKLQDIAEILPNFLFCGSQKTAKTLEIMTGIISFVSTCKKNNQKILIHCLQGVSRSVFVCATYLVVGEKMTLQNAIELIRKQKPNARPNKGWLELLIQIEMDALGTNSVTDVSQLEKMVSKRKN